MVIHQEIVRNKTILNVFVDDTALLLVILSINQHFLKKLINPLC